MKKRIVISFSGGKDSTLALHRLMTSDEWEIDSLFTTITEDYKRTSIHGVRETLLEQQASSLGIPLRKAYIPKACSNELYEQIMGKEVQKMMDDNVTHMMFGDIHLEDVKEYREKMLSQTSLKPVFPLWGEDPKKIMNEFLHLGFQTVLTCVDSKQLDSAFVGRVIDHEFIKDLPSGVDFCGENGEFHTFVFKGPIFETEINFIVSDEKTVTKDVYSNQDRFYFVDLLPTTDR
ncbi:diphthine--ammonia ligase [Bacillus sp. DJP31]|uniref:Dph6-related ATP pyrophosphatase n=1 Tax=Bacillus sp. DJP31 TaxID=3409789 RepID=UPI003BB52C57